MPARRSILSPVVSTEPTSEPSAAPVPVTNDTATEKTSATNKRTGMYHLGGYFPRQDPVMVAFRQLSFDTEQTHEKLLLEAITDLIAKYKTARAFGEGA